MLEQIAGFAFNFMPHALRMKAVRGLANQQIKRYGQMTHIDIDKAQRRIDVELMLAGEKEPIRIQVESYQLGEQSISVSGVTVSREWMQVLADDLLTSKPVAVPPDAMKWLKLIL